MAAPVIITIGGVDKTLDFPSPSRGPQPFDIEKGLNQRDVLRAVTDDTDSTATAFRPALLDEIIVEDLSSNVLFGGYIIDVDDGPMSSVATAFGTRTKISATDFSGYADRVYVETSRPEESLEDRVAALTTAYLTQFSVTLGAMATGPTLSAAEYGLVKLSDVFNLLSDLTGYVWWIDADKELQWLSPGALAAPFNITDGDLHGIFYVRWKQTLGQFANRVHVRIGTGSADKIEILTADGIADEFPLTYVLSTSSGNVLINGTAYVPFVPEPPGPGEWSIRAGLTRRLIAGTVPVIGTTMEVSYTATFPMTVTVEDSADITARGLWEVVAVAEDVFDYAAGQAIGNGLLRRYGTSPQEVTYALKQAGLRPGQTQTIAIADRTLSGSFLITSVKIRPWSDAELVYDVTAISGAEYQGSAADFWKGLMGGSAVSTVSGGTVGGVTTIVGGPIWMSLGGSLARSVEGTAWTAVPEALDISGTDFVGLTITGHVQVRTRDASITVTPRIVRVSDSAVMSLGSASTSTTGAWQVMPAFVAVAGETYRLQIQLASAAGIGWGMGYAIAA